MGSYEKQFSLGVGVGNRFIASEKLIKVYLLWPIRYRLNKSKATMKKKKNLLHYKAQLEGI